MMVNPKITQNINISFSHDKLQKATVFDEFKAYLVLHRKQIESRKFTTLSVFDATAKRSIITHNYHTFIPP